MPERPGIVAKARRRMAPLRKARVQGCDLGKKSHTVITVFRCRPRARMGRQIGVASRPRTILYQAPA